MLDLRGPYGGELFVVVQLPFADLRSLIGPASGRLDRPSWPLVEPRVDFVRSFGQISPRRRGGVAEWAGEEMFCRANSAVRFPNHLRKVQLGAAPLAANIDSVSRRFNSDGTVARFEACFQLAIRPQETAANEVLTVEVGKLAAQLPPEEAEKVSRDLQTLTTEATSKSPRKAWYELSGKGLVDAAKTVAAMAGPITTAVKAVLSLLAG
jgi:hypothetical protein